MRKEGEKISRNVAEPRERGGVLVIMGGASPRCSIGSSYMSLGGREGGGKEGETGALTKRKKEERRSCFFRELRTKREGETRFLLSAPRKKKKKKKLQFVA